MGDNIEWGETLQEAIERIYIAEALKGMKEEISPKEITAESYKKKLDELLKELEDMLRKMQQRISDERKKL